MNVADVRSWFSTATVGMQLLLGVAVLVSLAGHCLAPDFEEPRSQHEVRNPWRDYLDLPGSNVKIPDVLRLNNTAELIGWWIVIPRYLVNVLAKKPIKAEFFSDFLERRKHASFHNLLDQVRTHQPYIYQLFQVMVVFTNIGVAAGVSIILLRLMGTCGASTCQDVTINYRLLFHTYTGSSWVAGGIILSRRICYHV